MYPEYQINGRVYSREQLISQELPVEDEYLRRALSFCGEWLSGRNTFLQETSGSTGQPKVIALQREQMQASAAFTCEALQLQQGMHALVCVNVDYIAGKMMLVRCLQLGMQMTIVQPAGNPLMQKDLQLPLHFTAMVPMQVENALADPESKKLFKQINKVIIGGAVISQKLVKKIEGFPNQIYATYGMTETVSHIALQKLNGKDRQDYFQAFPEVMLGLDDRGCLTIQSVLSHHKKLVTNDVVALISADQFRWLGRADLVINSGGVKIQIEELEESIGRILDEHAIQLKFLISSRPDQKLGEKVVMVIEGNEYPKDLRQLLQKQLPAYHIPKEYICLSEFSATASGKTDRVTIKNMINEATI